MSRLKTARTFLVIGSVFLLICVLRPVYAQITEQHIIFSEWCSIAAVVMLIVSNTLLAICDFEDGNKIRATVLAISVVAVLCLGCVRTYKLASDMNTGPKTITLYDCEFKAPGRLFEGDSWNYKVVGKDSEGNELRFVISREDYIENGNLVDVEIVYYEKIERVAKIEPLVRLEGG